MHGEGGWTHHVGEAEMTLGDGRVIYDVYAGDVKFNDTYYVTGLMLMARRPMPRASKYVQLPKLICCCDDMRDTNMQMIRLPFLPNPTVCQQIVSLKPRGKCQTFESMDISVTNGVRRYVCRFEEWIKEDREMVLSIPDDLFRYVRETP